MVKIHMSYVFVVFSIFGLNKASRRQVAEFHGPLESLCLERIPLQCYCRVNTTVDCPSERYQCVPSQLRTVRTHSLKRNLLVNVLIEHLNCHSINNQLALLLHHRAGIATMSRIILEHVHLHHSTMYVCFK